VRPGDKFRVFAELYGVSSGASVQTMIHITRNIDRTSVREQLRLKGGREERSISFTDPAVPDARGIVILDVEVAGDLIPGPYTMEVRVVTSGRATSRTAKFIVE
jgi:hypothetical protein